MRSFVPLKSGAQLVDRLKPASCVLKISHRSFSTPKNIPLMTRLRESHPQNPRAVLLQIYQTPRLICLVHLSLQRPDFPIFSCLAERSASFGISSIVSVNTP